MFFCFYFPDWRRGHQLKGHTFFLVWSSCWFPVTFSRTVSLSNKLKKSYTYTDFFPVYGRQLLVPGRHPTLLALHDQPRPVQGLSFSISIDDLWNLPFQLSDALSYRSIVPRVTSEMNSNGTRPHCAHLCLIFNPVLLQRPESLLLFWVFGRDKSRYLMNISRILNFSEGGCLLMYTGAIVVVVQTTRINLQGN